MLMSISEARKSIKEALKKFGAKKLNHWSDTKGSLHQLFELPSGTQLKLIITPHFNGEDIEVKWQWILTA